MKINIQRAYGGNSNIPTETFDQSEKDLDSMRRRKSNNFFVSKIKLNATSTKRPGVVPLKNESIVSSTIVTVTNEPNRLMNEPTRSQSPFHFKEPESPSKAPKPVGKRDFFNEQRPSFSQA